MVRIHGLGIETWDGQEVDVEAALPVKSRSLPLSLKSAAEWKTNQRITGGTYEWVEDRHVLAVSTPAEIPLLMDLMAACYLRLSDECL